MSTASLSNDEAVRRAIAKVERLQLAYQRVFGGGRATQEDRTLVLADLETVCSVRRNMLRETEHATFYEMGKFSVWHRINNMRFPRPPDAKSEFRASVERTGGLNNEQETDQVRQEAGRGVAEPTDD